MIHQFPSAIPPPPSHFFQQDGGIYVIIPSFLETSGETYHKWQKLLVWQLFNWVSSTGQSFENPWPIANIVFVQFNVTKTACCSWKESWFSGLRWLPRLPRSSVTSKQLNSIIAREALPLLLPQPHSAVVAHQQKGSRDTWQAEVSDIVDEKEDHSRVLPKGVHVMISMIFFYCRQPYH